jgi:hypothetical protein
MAAIRVTWSSAVAELIAFISYAMEFFFCFTILMCLTFESNAFIISVHKLDSKPRIVDFVSSSLAPKVPPVSFEQFPTRIYPPQRSRYMLLGTGMSALGPIGPFTPFRSSYCSSGVVEQEMGQLTMLAEKLSTKFSRMMLGFQVFEE